MTQSINIRHDLKMTKARTALVLDHPFFGAIALSLNVKEDSSCQTAWTDGKSLGYNPDFIDGLTLRQTIGLIAHECAHVMLAHHARRESRDKHTWNVAADYAINPILQDSKFELPKGALIDRSFGNYTEQIYNAIYSPSDPDDQSQGNPTQGSGFGEVRDFPADSPSDMAQAKQDAEILVSQSYAIAKSQGSVSGALKELIEKILEPKIDWRDVLRNFITTVTRDDYSWTRVNRRFVSQGLILPSLYSKKIGKIICGVDTSGSMSSNALAQVASEITSIIEDTDAELTVIYCDTQVGRVDNFDRDSLPVKLNAVGRGGTSFRPVFNYISEFDLEPECMIYLTDGYAPNQFDFIPDYPVLWGIIEGDKDFNPSFGQVVPITTLDF